MAVMLSKTYAAFKDAGASEESAREAAEEIADLGNRLNSIDNRLSNVEGRLTIITLIGGLTIAGIVALLAKAYG